MTKLISTREIAYPELSYKVVGLIFKIHNELGAGLREKSYEDALELAFKNEGLNYKRQIHCPIYFNGEKVGSRFLDFLVDGKIILELKAGDKFSKANLNQINEYLKSNNLKLGILANFGSEQVKFRRIVNLI